MPLPFKLHHGKVGKIYIDGITSVLTSPLVIEITDVFIFIKPKDFNMWDEKIEIEAFINSTLKSLEKYETYLNEKT
jgi:hypothetical protein